MAQPTHGLEERNHKRYKRQEQHEQTNDGPLPTHASRRRAPCMHGSLPFAACRHRATQLTKHCQHVVPYRVLGAWGPQQVCRVERGHDCGSTFVQLPGAAQTSDSARCTEQPLYCCGSERNNHLWTHEFELSLQVRPACSHFLGKRLSILRWSALHAVADVHPLAPT